MPVPRRGLVAAIGEGYRHPRAAVAQQRAGEVGEAEAIAYLLAACGLGFVASLPAAITRATMLPTDDPVGLAVAAQLFGFLFLAPLLLYGLAALVHLVARAFGGRGSWLGVRVALFWSLLLAAPAALGVALAGVGLVAAFGTGVLPVIDFLRYAVLAFWFWLFATSLAEAEGFRQPLGVVAVVAASFGGLAFLVTILGLA